MIPLVNAARVLTMIPRCAAARGTAAHGKWRKSAVILLRATGAVNQRGANIDSMSTPHALETFPNPRPEREYEIAIDCPEFTSMCPKTGLPDFGTIRIRYVPEARCIELKSLKYYLMDYRNQGIFYEAATNKILDDLVAACQPRRMTVIGDFTARGGITTKVTADYAR
jgi:7-cyano-7-deazaguanine reductase